MRLESSATPAERRAWLDGWCDGALLSLPVVLWCLGHSHEEFSHEYAVPLVEMWHAQVPAEDVRGILDSR